MKALIQWATKKVEDWYEVNTSDLPSMPIKDDPGPQDNLDNKPGWINAVNIQGVLIAGYDHYNFQWGTDAEGEWVKVTSWTVEDLTVPEASKKALVSIFRSIRRDQYGSWNTSQNFESYGYEIPNFSISNREYFSWDSFIEPTDGVTFHGKQLTDIEYAERKSIQSHHGWREWTEDIPSEELVNGEIPAQRPLGRYSVPLGTITWWPYYTANALATYNASNELGVTQTEPSSSSGTTYPEEIRKNSSELTHAFATAGSYNPGFATWPAGSVGSGYRFQIDCTSCGADITYGLLSSIDNEAGFYRIDSTDSAQWQVDMSQSAFSGTGQKLATNTSVSESTNASDDKFAVALAAANGHAKDNQTITIAVNDTDSWMDGPWTTGNPQTATLSVSAVTPVQNSVTATFQAPITAGTSELATQVQINPVYDYYEVLKTAALSEVIAAVVQNATNGQASNSQEAALSELTVTPVQNPVTANFELIYDASLTVLTSTPVQNIVTATYQGIYNATLSEAVVISVQNPVTATYLINVDGVVVTSDPPVGVGGELFPSISGTNKGSSLSVSNFDVDLPTGYQEGDQMLLAIASYNEVEPASISGWTLIESKDHGDDAGWTLDLYKRTATASETDPFTVTLSGTGDVSWLLYTVSDCNAIEAAPIVEVASVSVTPPSLSPSWGFSKTLWLTIATNNSYNQGLPITRPNNYTDSYDQRLNGAWPQIFSDRRYNEASTETPTNYSWGSVNYRHGVTVAFEPSATGVEATYDIDKIATLSELAIASVQNQVTATSVSEYSASFNELVPLVTQNSVTASGGGEYNATLSEVVVTPVQNSVTATSVAEYNATLSEVVVTPVQNLVSASSGSQINATLSEAVITPVQNPVTATSVAEYNATLSEVVVTPVQNQVNGTYDIDIDATIAELSVTPIQNLVTATSVAEYNATLSEVIAAVVQPQVNASSGSQINAVLSEVVATSIQNQVIPTYTSELSATLNEVSVTPIQNEVTGEYSSYLTAALNELSIAPEQNLVTASSLLEVIASLQETTATVTQPVVDANTSSNYNAPLTEISITPIQNLVTPIYESIVTASLTVLNIVPEIFGNATFVSEFNAQVNTLNITPIQNLVTQTYEANFSAITTTSSLTVLVNDVDCIVVIKPIAQIDTLIAIVVQPQVNPQFASETINFLFYVQQESSINT
jgi:hypothetical protein